MHRLDYRLREILKVKVVFKGQEVAHLASHMSQCVRTWLFKFQLQEESFTSSEIWLQIPIIFLSIFIFIQDKKIKVLNHSLPLKNNTQRWQKE